jgi:hypothetical protein
MRARIQSGIAASMLLALADCSGPAAPVADDESRLSALFAEPPFDARPETLWYWMNGNVSADGITRDLEAMRDIGLGRAIIFDGGIDAPPGPAEYLGSEWRTLMQHAIEEARRLGLELGVHNAPGWSSSGGPWITPALSMQQLVWTETVIEGGTAVDITLPRPRAKLDYYEDALVVAIPSQAGEEEPLRAVVRGARSGGADIDVGRLMDENRNTSVPAGPTSGIVLNFGERFEARALTVALASPYSPQTVRLEASDDGRTWQTVGTAEVPYPRGIETPGVLSFEAVRARYYRLVPGTNVEVAELYLHGAPRLTDWTFKAGFGYRVDAARQRARQAVDADSAIDPARVLDLAAFMDGDGRLRWDQRTRSTWRCATSIARGLSRRRKRPRRRPSLPLASSSPSAARSAGRISTGRLRRSLPRCRRERRSSIWGMGS